MEKYEGKVRGCFETLANDQFANVVTLEEGTRREALNSMRCPGFEGAGTKIRIRLLWVGFTDYRKLRGCTQDSRTHPVIASEDQNGLTTTRITTRTINAVGTSLIAR